MTEPIQDQLHLPLVTRLAQQLNQPVVFLDFETTTNIVSSPEFGVTEIAYLVVLPSGKQKTFTTLVNPENSINPRATELNGITNEMVAGEQNFAAHADRLRLMFNASVIFTYNGDTFDIPAALTQMDRYGQERPTNCQSVDVYKAWKKIQNVKGGKLTEVASHYGVSFDGAHRALADVYGLANVMEQMLWQHGANFAADMAIAAFDPAAPSSTGAKRNTSSASKELTPVQGALKNLIDQLIAVPLEVSEFAAKLLSAGYALEITKGGAAYTHAESKERCGGSALGADYSWAKVAAKLTGETPAELIKGTVYGQNPSSGARAPSGGSAVSNADRTAEERKAREAIAAVFQETGAVSVEAALARSGLPKASSISFAMGLMLVDGSLAPEAARHSEAQQWLESRLERLIQALPDRKLKPLLSAAQAERCPPSVDYVQLRVAIMEYERKNGLEPSAKAMPAKAPARPAPAPAPARPAPAAQPASPPEPPSYLDDAPPFDEPFEPMGEAYEPPAPRM